MGCHNGRVDVKNVEKISRGYMVQGKVKEYVLFALLLLLNSTNTQCIDMYRLANR
jgi:hypothetical protein